MQDGIDIVAGLCLASDVIGIVLNRSLQTVCLEDMGNAPGSLSVGHVPEREDFMAVCTEDIVFTSSEIGVNLAWEDCILRDICPS